MQRIRSSHIYTPGGAASRVPNPTPCGWGRYDLSIAPDQPTEVYSPAPELHLGIMTINIIYRVWVIYRVWQGDFIYTVSCVAVSEFSLFTVFLSLME